MTTVTLHADEELLEKATEVLAKTSMTLDQAFERTLREIAERKESVRRYDEMMGEFRKRGVTLPILSREERNARR